MARKIFLVNAMVVDENGTMSIMSGYPKSFDSKNYGGDADKAYRRADGDASECWGTMCKNDTRQLQTVTLEDVDGVQYYKRSMGTLAEPNTDEE